MNIGTTPVPSRRLLVAILAWLNLLVAPCVMALAPLADHPACGHCATGDGPACLATSPGNLPEDGAPATGRARPPVVPSLLAVLPAEVPVGGLHLRLVVESPRARVARTTGRHSGDPPVEILLGRFLA